MLTLLIDNYDSYTYNLFQLLAEVNGEEPVVVRNDERSWHELCAGRRFDNVVLSPGPGHPARERDFGVCADAIRLAEVPLLGVCLGHQGIAWVSGGRVERAPAQMHGRTSQIRHDTVGLFANLPQDFTAVRYHSLCVTGMPSELTATAWAEDGVVMALRHRHRPTFGLQFHPESVCTEHGRALLVNFREASRHRPEIKPRSDPRPAARPAQNDDLSLLVQKLADPVDSEAAYIALYADSPFAFWLDSSRAEPPLARFSFMGDSSGPISQVAAYALADNQLTVTTANEGEQILTRGILGYLREQLQARRCDRPDLPFDFCGGFVGYLGYELKRLCGADGTLEADWPDAQVIFADRFVAFDHDTGETYLVSLARNCDRAVAERWLEATRERLRTLPSPPPPSLPLDGPPPGEPLTFTLHRSREQYLQAIERAKELIAEGETYEVCLTNEISTSATPDPLELYRLLRARNPAPYAAFLRFGERSVVSCSPERYLRIDRAGTIEAKPIKGTAPRSFDPRRDAELAERLRDGEKDRAENLMIVDLLRNDLGRVSTVGSVAVPRLMEIESYENVHQLVSTITARLGDGYDAIAALTATFPGGSMTGAPKLRTMEIIETLEQRPRGVYSGTIAALSVNGTADMSIVIRTVTLDPTGARIGAGGAIVSASHPAAEFDEMMLKARVLLETLALACTGQADAYHVNGARACEEPAGGVTTRVLEPEAAETAL
jgi:para-aminobenzoate synthetase